jgi:hypothetical protein
MNESGLTLRATVITFFPMFIATLSLVTSIFNGYLNARFLDVMQRNVGRGEYMRTCKDIIDAYFQVKAKAAQIQASAASGSGGVTPQAARAEAAMAVSHFAALGTYLANLRDDVVRARYSELSQLLERILVEAAQPSSDLGKLFAPADEIFGSMNQDCIKSAQAAPM